MGSSDEMYSLGMDLAGLMHPIAIEDVGLNQVGYFRVLALWDGADYLLIAKPVAFNQLGIRCDCATLFK